MKGAVYSVEVKIDGSRYGAVNVIPDALAILLGSKKYSEAVGVLEEAKSDPLCGSKMIISSHIVTIKKNMVDLDRWADFSNGYWRELDKAYLLAPESYDRPLNETYGIMLVSVLNGSFNKDSETFKAVCKALRIKHTYKAIAAFITGEDA
jgi:hypothetical protein